MRNLVYRRATLPRGMADEGRFLDEQIVTAGESMLTFSSHTRFRDAMLGGSDWLHVTESARACNYYTSFVSSYTVVSDSSFHILAVRSGCPGT